MNRSPAGYYFAADIFFCGFVLVTGWIINAGFSKCQRIYQLSVYSLKAYSLLLHMFWMPVLVTSRDLQVIRLFTGMTAFGFFTVSSSLKMLRDLKAVFL